MAEHFTKSQIQRFAVTALPPEQLQTVAGHLAECQSCHQTLAEALRRQRGTGTVAFSLDPAFLFRHDHLDYEQLAAIADQKLNATEQEITDIHVSTCVTCREDVRSFLEFRKQIEPELRVRYGPTADRSKTEAVPLWNPWRLFDRKAAYVAAVLLIAVGLLIVALYMRRTSGNFEVRQTPPSQNNSPAASPTLENQTAGQLPPPPPPAPPEQSPQRAPSPVLAVNNRQTARAPETVGEVAVLNDGRGTVTVDKAGNVSGLNDISPDMRREIAETMTTQSIRQPDTVTELAGAPMTLRGPDEGLKFKLRSPARTVILSDRPSFQWDGLPGATSYQVLIGDLTGHEITRSGSLPSDRTTWTPPSPLKRGEIYAWQVEAVVNGKKVFAPGTSETQMKFKILSDTGARELEQLKKTDSHLALAVFYAREGMVTEAEHEIQTLVHDNPKSAVLRTLLTQLQSWR